MRPVRISCQLEKERATIGEPGVSHSVAKSVEHWISMLSFMVIQEVIYTMASCNDRCQAH